MTLVAVQVTVSTAFFGRSAAVWVGVLIVVMVFAMLIFTGARWQTGHREQGCDKRVCQATNTGGER
jgi:hypothetical protein